MLGRGAPLALVAFAVLLCTAVAATSPRHSSVGTSLSSPHHRITPSPHRQPPRAPEILYDLTLRNDLDPPRFIVSIRAAVPLDEKSVRFQMPVWAPGDYHVQNFARYIGEPVAQGKNGPLKIQRPDPNTWLVEADDSPWVRITYTVPQTPPGIFSDNVTIAPHYAFINGPAAFAYVVGWRTAPVRLVVSLPQNWRAEMPLDPALSIGDSTAFSAPDYDALVDSPLVAADPQGEVARDFEVDHVPHRAVFFHTPIDAAQADAFVPMLRQVAQAENDIMGGPPYKRYEFLFDVGGGGGGLEHRNSARLNMFPGQNPQGFDAFVAHEFFHLWNVKRIRPAVLGPFDYEHPPKTRNLWFAEGVTEYYAHVAVRRAGLADRAAFRRHWRSAIARLQRNPARLRVSADDASLHVWETGNSEGFNGLSYYDKGELIGLCLDLKIRHATGGAKSLDDVMRLLLERHNPPKPGYGEDEIRATVSEVAGIDLCGFYDLLARSTQEMPFAECLAYAGLDLNLSPQANATAEQVNLRDAWER
ncbi:MAG TPA: hypothetical protein VKT77_23705 [Chthonomonadaceae bacterium]|nr:hypothetical protein [Chthonomonadaceae bacterium]